MLRNLKQSDVAHLLAIESAVHVVPWTAQVFEHCFQAGYPGWVMADEREVYGYIIVAMSLQECHILNIGVAKSYQRQGIATKLIEHVLAFAKDQHAHLAYLEVRRSNLGAIALYEKLHFMQLTERKNYYPDPVHGQHEDALIFAKELL